MIRLAAGIAAGAAVWVIGLWVSGLLPTVVTRMAARANTTRPQRRTSRRIIAVAQAAAACGVAAVGISTVSAWWLTFPIALAVGMSIGALADRRNTRIWRRTQEAWPYAVRYLLSEIEGDATLQAATRAMALSGPEAIRGVFARYEALAALDSYEAALRAVAADAADATCDRVCEVLIHASRLGSTEAPVVLRDLLEDLIEQRTVLERIRTESNLKIIEKHFALGSPWAALVLLMLVSSNHREFYFEPSGGWAILGASVWLFGGWLYLRAKLKPIPAEPRVIKGIGGG